MATKRNGEGYYDPTAYLAERNIERSERRQQQMSELKRGDIFYVNSIYNTGSEQGGARPAIIVSGDKNNRNSRVVEVVYLTRRPKADLPTHVSIRSTGSESTALCEQISSVAVERIGSYYGHVTDAEMANLEIAMMISLDLSVGTSQGKVKEVIKEVPMEVIKEVPVPAPVQDDSESAALKQELASITAKYEMLQDMYDALLGRVVKAAG